MSTIHKFFFKYCRKGHMLYSAYSNLTEARCEQCGDEYIDSCVQCGAKLTNSFTSQTYFTSRKPVNFPKRPAFCRVCGKPHPWTDSVHQKIDASGLWSLLHPRVATLAKPRFDSGHYADAVESVFKELNSVVKELFIKSGGDELDGVPLMRKAFSPSNPVISLDNLKTETGRNIQQGYMDLFAGSIAGIRNPKAHNNIDISAERAAHHLMLASLLFFKLEERP
jgi:uncharacterized protein (TIGR02391 family)